MVVQYTVCGVDIPYPRRFPDPVHFPYSSFLKVFLHNLIPGLLYPGNFSYPGKFPYPIKD